MTLIQARKELKKAEKVYCDLLRKNLYRKIAKIFKADLSLQGIGFVVDQWEEGSSSVVIVNKLGYNEEFFISDDWSERLREVAVSIQKLCNQIDLRHLDAVFDDIEDNYIHRSQIMAA